MDETRRLGISRDHLFEPSWQAIVFDGNIGLVNPLFEMVTSLESVNNFLSLANERGDALDGDAHNRLQGPLRIPAELLPVLNWDKFHLGAFRRRLIIFQYLCATTSPANQKTERLAAIKALGCDFVSFVLPDHHILSADILDLADAPIQEVTLIARRGTDDITADGNGGIEKPGLAALRDLPVDRFRLIIVTALAPGPRNSCGALTMRMKLTSSRMAPMTAWPSMDS